MQLNADTLNAPPIRILTNLARAGGTLVSRCLGAMDRTVLLSEIHPQGMHIFNPLMQAQDWYQLFSPGELPERLPFTEAMQKIYDRCLQNNTQLIIRDWAHLDFIGRPFLEKPSYTLQLTKSLMPAFDVVQFALVRHPIDQWVSTSRLKVMQGQLDLNGFLAGYRRFAEQAVKTGFMRYEDFTREPEVQMQRLCRYLDIVYDPGFIGRWQEYTRVTGDVSKVSRGSLFNEIKPLDRHSAGQSLMGKFHSNPDYHRAIELLGYNTPSPSPGGRGRGR